MTKFISDENIKTIFDNLRNLGLCAIVLAAAAYFSMHSAQSQLRIYEVIVAVFLFFVGVFLATINIVHGMEKLKQLPYSKVGRGAFLALYGVLAMELIGAVIVFRIGQ